MDFRLAGTAHPGAVSVRLTNGCLSGLALEAVLTVTCDLSRLHLRLGLVKLGVRMWANRCHGNCAPHHNEAPRHTCLRTC